METFVAGKSAPFHLSSDEKLKVLKAFGYASASAILAGFLAVLALPPNQLPLWLIPITPLLNTFIYASRLYLMDNRE